MKSGALPPSGRSCPLFLFFEKRRGRTAITFVTPFSCGGEQPGHCWRTVITSSLQFLLFGVGPGDDEGPAHLQQQNP